MKAVNHVIVVLFVLQFVIAFVSWVVSAVFPETGIQNMLSGEGVRCTLNRLSNPQLMPPLMWLVLLTMAYGTMRNCRLASDLAMAIRRNDAMTYRQKVSLWSVFALLLVIVGILTLLTAFSFSPLQSVTGGICNSPFTHGIIPIIAISVTTLSLAYGLFTGLPLSQIIGSTYSEFKTFAPIYIIYILIAQTIQQLIYIIN